MIGFLSVLSASRRNVFFRILRPKHPSVVLSYHLHRTPACCATGPSASVVDLTVCMLGINKNEQIKMSSPTVLRCSVRTKSQQFPALVANQHALGTECHHFLCVPQRGRGEEAKWASFFGLSSQPSEGSFWNTKILSLSKQLSSPKRNRSGL